MSAQSTKGLSDLECYLVGGAVRDRLLNIKDSDQDWVVVGTTEEVMLSLGFRPIGKDFPVFLHPQTHEEYALARTERKVGHGYRGFEVNAPATVTLEQDLYRRDLTINAMALDTQGNLIDPFGGQQDLENGLLRHVSTHFSEDPLRVLRAARFAARYHSRGFIIDDATLDLMRQISASGELNELVTERVWQEVRRALAEDHPAVFFNVLHICDALDKLLPELDCLFASKTQRTSTLKHLETAAYLTSDVEIRFALLAYLFNQCASALLTDPDEAHAVRQFCRRLKTPASFCNLAVQVAKFTDRVLTVKATPPIHSVDMILELNGLRDAERFEQFLNACAVVLNVIHANDSQLVQPAITLFKNCRDAMRRADLKSLAKQYQGNQLRTKVRGAYARQIANLLAQPTREK